MMWFKLLVVAGFAVTAYNTAKVYDHVADLTLNQEFLFQNQLELAHRIEESAKVNPSKRRPEQAGLKVVHQKEQIKHNNLDVFCLAKNIFHEAGVEDKIGKYAVAQVTLNRKYNRNYPGSICEVVMQPYQFSWANDRSIRWTHPRGPLWEESKRIAEDVIKNGARVPDLDQALFYHADYVSPRWKKPEAKIAKVGTHIFYASAR